MMVRLAVVEPATLGLEVRCSIQLSYRRVLEFSRVTARASSEDGSVMPEIMPARRLVVGAKILCDLLVPDSVGTRQDRLAGRGAPLSCLHESLSLRALLRSRALAHGAAVHVVLSSPHAPWCAIPRLLFVQGPH